MHEHPCCKHEKIQFCSVCDETYCEECKKVWVKPCQKSHYNVWTSSPVPFPSSPWTSGYAVSAQTAGNLVSSDTTGNALTSDIASTNCKSQ